MKMFLKAAAIAVAFCAASGIAHADAVVGGFDATPMPVQDDTASEAVSLGFEANYFGTTFSRTFVSTNGYITFAGPQSEYNPVGLGAGYSGQPIIAPFYADVDIRLGGRIGYGTGQFGGRNAFGVTYNNVAVFGGSTDDKRNTFQLLLVDRNDTGLGNFDILLNYDRIQWETGSANGSNGTNGLGGNSAAVGYNAGQAGNPDGSYFELPGSRVNGALLDGGANALTGNSNAGIDGRYVFNVRNGLVAPPPVTESAVPEPASWAMMVIGFGAVGGSLRRRRQSVRVVFNR